MSQTLELFADEKVVLTVERDGANSFLTKDGPVAMWLWVTQSPAGVRALLVATLGLRKVSQEVVCPNRDLAAIYAWLVESTVCMTIGYGVATTDVGRLRMYLNINFGEPVKQKAGELGQRPGIPAGLPIAGRSNDQIPIPVSAAPEETVIFNSGSYKRICGTDAPALPVRLGNSNRPSPPLVHTVNGKTTHLP